MSESKKCMHEGCSCVVPQGQHYCSNYCKNFYKDRVERMMAGATSEQMSEVAAAGTLPNVSYEGEPCECGHRECRKP